MQIYLAPLEGITGYVFRNAYAKYYGGVNKYFTPFISPHTKKTMDAREKRDILPENNEGLHIVPQVLTNKAEDLIAVCKELKAYGYNEVNLNLGCPSKTVTTKQKGAGFLEHPKDMEAFFDFYFSHCDMSLSIKTRIGMWDIEESDILFDLYERYPFSEVIVHPRLGQELYRGKAHRDVFEKYLTQTKHTLCYNGDINSKDDLIDLSNRWSGCEKFMLGRGLIANPSLLLQDVPLMSKEEMTRFQQFHDQIVSGYESYMCGDRNVLFKMKELWSYWSNHFKGQEKYIKKIKKANTLAEYRPLVNLLIQSQFDL